MNSQLQKPRITITLAVLASLALFALAWWWQP